MPKTITNYSDNGRANLLKQAIATAAADEAKGNSYVSAETIQRADNILPGWTSVINNVNHFLSDRAKQVREKNAGLNHLELVERDVWEVLKRRIIRNGEPPEVHTFYGLPQSGLVPRSLTNKDVFGMATSIIDGDARAVEAGYPAMLNPDVNELKEALDVAQKEIEDVAPADRAYDQAEEEVEKLRTEVDDIIKDIIDELRFNLRKKDGASQRRIIKSYGVEISYNKNEPVDTDNSIVDEE